MNARGNLHLDAAIPVTVAARSLKVMRVSQNRAVARVKSYCRLSDTRISSKFVNSIELR